MPTVAFDHQGSSYEAEVDETFFKKPEAEQQAALLSHLGGTTAPKPPQREDTSMAGALGYGMANSAAGFQTTTQRLGLTDVDKAGRTQADPSYSPAGPQVYDGIKTGDLGKAGSYLPRAIAENLPDLGGTLAAGRVGAGIGGAIGSVVPVVGTAVGAGVGGLLGAGAYSAYRAFGGNVEARAANNGREDPNAADYAGGALTTAGTSALDAVGARGLGPAVSGLSALGKVRQATTGALREGGTEVAQSLVEQTGQTAGTDKGLSVDPVQALTDGAVGFGTAGAIRAPGVAGSALKAGGSAAVDATVAAARRPMEAAAAEAMNAGDPEQARSIIRVTDAVQRRMETTTGREATPDEHLNGLREEITTSLRNAVRQAEDGQGWMTPTQSREINAVLSTAASHNKSFSLGEEITDTDGPTPRYGLQVIEGINAPAEFKTALSEGFRDLDNLAFSARKKNLRGPMENLFSKAGNVAALATGFAAGGVPGLGVASLGVLGGSQSVPARAGAAVGRWVDRKAGLGEPVLNNARPAAERTLGDEARGPDTLSSLESMRRQLLDPATAVPTTADQVRESSHFLGLVKRRWDTSQPIDESVVARLTPEHRTQLVEWLDAKNERVGKRVGEGDQAFLDEGARIAAQAEQQRLADIERASPRVPALPRSVPRDANAAFDALDAQRAREEDKAWRGEVLTDARSRLRDDRVTPVDPNPLVPEPDNPAIMRARNMAAARQPLPASPGASAIPPPSSATPPGARPAAPQPTVRPTVPAEPEAPTSTAWSGSVPGWMRGVIDFSYKTQNAKLTADHVERAVDLLEEEGGLSPSEAGRIRAADREISSGDQRKITDRALQLIGRSKRDPYAASPMLTDNDGPNGGDNPVRNRYQTESAERSYQSAVDAARSYGTQSGDFELVKLAGLFGTSTKSALDGPARIALATALIAKDPAASAARDAFLEPLLARYRK